MPGFIALMVYDMFVPGDRRDTSKAVLEIVTYSILINFIAVLVIPHSFRSNHPGLVLFIQGILLPAAITTLYYFFAIKYRKVHPYLKAWDYVFSKRRPAWVIVTLKDGRRIGGEYGDNSFASSYPAKEQIFIERTWKLDENRNFIEPYERSSGIILLGDDILTVEFYG